MDENGYYCASFGGVSGLVPANFVQEAEVSDFSIRERLFNQVRTTHTLTFILKLKTVYFSRHWHITRVLAAVHLP